MDSRSGADGPVVSVPVKSKSRRDKNKDRQKVYAKVRLMSVSDMNVRINEEYNRQWCGICHPD